MKCPNCNNQHVRHKGEKVLTITTKQKRKVTTRKHDYAWSEKGYICRKCGWQS